MSEVKTHTSLSQAAYEKLRRDLVNGTLAPGNKLMISDLRDRYGLGAMPIREALNRLSSERLVQKHEQRGFSVPPLDGDGFLEVQSARLVIETAALRQSVRARSAEWEDRLVLAFHHLSKALPCARDDDGQPEWLLSDAWSACHRAFHFELISGCENTWLLTFAHQLYEQSSRYRTRTRQIATLRPPVRSNLIEEHRDIMEAAIAGDAEIAVERLIEHYRLSVEIVLGTPISLVSDPLGLARSHPEEANKPASLP